MAKGRDKHDARVADVVALGRELNRRARSRCELCGDNTSLKVVEVPPLPEEPAADHALMVCERCQPLVAGQRVRADTDTLRFLAETVWAELPAVKVVSVRAARKLAEDGVPWAVDAVDGIWLDETVEEWVSAG